MPEKIRHDARRLLEAKAARLHGTGRRQAQVDELEQFVRKQTPWVFRWVLDEAWWRDVASQAVGGLFVLAAASGVAWAALPEARPILRSLLPATIGFVVFLTLGFVVLITFARWLLGRFREDLPLPSTARAFAPFIVGLGLAGLMAWGAGLLANALLS